MTREEAIKIIDCYDIGFYDLSGEKIPADKLADAFDMAIEALSVANLKEEFESADAEWILCSERLPIPPTFCLVTTDGSHGDVIDIALYMSDGWHKASEVIAWMPLPTPYKGGDEE